MADYLLLTDQVPRLAQSERGRTAWGLAQGLLLAGHRVTLLTAAEGSAAAGVPGLARRLKKLQATVGDRQMELGLFEGRFSSSEPQLLVVETPPSFANDPMNKALWLGAAAAVLTEQGLRADAVLGWGEATAPALERAATGIKFFVLPEGTVDARLVSAKYESAGTDHRQLPLAAVGANAAHAVLVPSSTAARALKNHPALTNRADDEPIVTIRFGSDDAPHDPGTDAALTAFFSPADLAGKAECRKAMARRLSLAVDSQTLLVACESLTHASGGPALLDALAKMVRGNVAAMLLAEGDRDLVERANLLSIENPTRVGLLRNPESNGADLRRMLAAADASILTEAQDLVGLRAGIALRYGALPIAPASSAAGDQLVDLDERSVTGSAVLYPADNAAGLEGGITRAASLRRNSGAWSTIIRSAIGAAPTWRRAAECIELLRQQYETGLEQKLVV